MALEFCYFRLLVKSLVILLTQSLMYGFLGWPLTLILTLSITWTTQSNHATTIFKSALNVSSFHKQLKTYFLIIRHSIQIGENSLRSAVCSPGYNFEPSTNNLLVSTMIYLSLFYKTTPPKSIIFIHSYAMIDMVR